MSNRFNHWPAFLLLAVFAGSSLQAQEAPLQLGSNRELFVDFHLIDRMDNLRLVLHEPRDEGPVFYFDQPWEGAFSAYCTIICDNGLFRAYYRGLPAAQKEHERTATVCIAESPDGINWRKPELGLCSVNGSAANNIVLANDPETCHNFCPFIDTRPDCPPEQRYKAVAGDHLNGLFGFVSADGINWRKIQEEGIFKNGQFDSQNVAFWSESEKCYVLYFRVWSGGGWDGFRTVSRTTSADFINWSEPQPMTFGETPMEHLYTQQTHPYFRAPQIYIAIGARFVPDRQVLSDEQAQQINVNPGYYKDCSDAVLLTSRGGNRYDRTFMESFIRPGIGLQNWVSRSNYPALNVVQTTPTEMSIYVNQDYAQPTAHLRRYSLRLDGFSSLAAPYGGGEMISKALIFTGNKLILNMATSAAGEIRVEIQDVGGTAIPGFGLENCQPVIGNEIERQVAWQRGADLGALAGRPVRLRFYMKDANLYAMQFQNSPEPLGKQ